MGCTESVEARPHTATCPPAAKKTVSSVSSSPSMYVSHSAGTLSEKAERLQALVAKEVPRFHKKYEMGEVLGEGQMGTVLRCWRRETGQEYAVKVCEKQGPKALAAISGLRSEAIARDALTKEYDNLMTVHKIYEAGTCSVQISERLSSKVRCGKVGSGQVFYKKEVVRSIVRGLVEGVAAMHANGVAHLDIKPDNLMLRMGADEHDIAPEDLKLIDFGSAARFTKGETDIFTATGSPYFCAPELLDAIQADRVGMDPFPVSALADIWSIGVVAHMLYTGHHPFAMRTPRSLGCLQNQLTQTYRPRPKAPVDSLLADFLSKCFALQANDRPSAEALLEHPYLDVSAPIASVDEDCTAYSSSLDVTLRTVATDVVSVAGPLPAQE